jgi:hypothetical protein
MEHMKREHNRDRKMDRQTICKLEHSALARRITRNKIYRKRKGGGKLRKKSAVRKLEM